MAEKLWSYPELKHVTVNQYKKSPQQLAQEVNQMYHKGEDVRSPEDISKIFKSRTIFNKDKPPR